MKSFWTRNIAVTFRRDMTVVLSEDPETSELSGDVGLLSSVCTRRCGPGDIAINVFVICVIVVYSISSREESGSYTTFSEILSKSDCIPRASQSH